MHDRSGALVVSTLIVSLLTLAAYGFSRLAGFDPLHAAVGALCCCGGLLIGSAVVMQSAKDAGWRMGALILFLPSATAVTALFWLFFKTTGGALFLFAGGAVLLACFLTTLFKNIDDQVKFGVVMASMIVELMAIMFILSP